MRALYLTCILVLASAVSICAKLGKLGPRALGVQNVDEKVKRRWKGDAISSICMLPLIHPDHVLYLELSEL